LSSGKRINSAKDDAAGYAVAEAVKSTKTITDQSIQNTQDAISLVQTAEGALDVVGKMLQRMLTLTTQKENGTLTDPQEASITNEIDVLQDEIAQIKSRTRFQGGSESMFGQSFTFTTGSGTSAPTQTVVRIADLSLTGLSKLATGVAASISGTTLTLSTGIDGSAPIGAKVFKNGVNTGSVVATTNKQNGSTSITVDATFAASAGDVITFHAVDGASTSGSITTAAIQSLAAAGTSLTVPALAVGQGATILSGARVYRNGVDTGRLVTANAADADTTIAITAGSAISVAVGDVFTFVTQRAISTTSSSADLMNAIQANISNRASLGTTQTQLNYIVDNMQTLSNNLSDALSRIVDTDYAAETAKLTRGQILQQAATSMLAQANQMPNVILTLLK
jgi:flagellin